MEYYELSPRDSHKSFYGKAIVKITENGSRILQSYQTDVIKKDKNGNVFLLCGEDKLSATTLRHILSFCGLLKKEVLKLKRA